MKTKPFHAERVAGVQMKIYRDCLKVRDAKGKVTKLVVRYRISPDGSRKTNAVTGSFRRALLMMRVIAREASGQRVRTKGGRP